MSIEIVYCLQSKQKRNEGKDMESISRDYLIKVLKNEFNSWSEVFNAKEYVKEDYGWYFADWGLLYPIYNDGVCIKEKDVFAVMEKDTTKGSLDGFSYWDNAWWRTC